MPFSKINTPDQNLNLVQDNVDKALVPLQQIPMVGGNVLSGVSLLSGQDNLVPHKLGRAVQYFIIMSLNAQSIIWTQAASALKNQSTDNIYINLRTSANCTATIWVN